MAGNSRILLIISLLAFILIGCNNGEAAIKSETEKNGLSEINESQLTASEKAILGSMKQMIKMANQIVKESDSIIKEAQSSDDLEGALDIMNISKEEVNKLLLEFKSDSKINNNDLSNLQKEIKKSLENYTLGIQQQEAGIKEGDGIKNQKGYVLTEEAKKEIRNLNSIFFD
ncbi:hypothetical protein CVD28_10720 [Bacillus sp. M6-12]|uniref:hypothetical protein n=1 Tax=Bacillus sp. M6-12 TaxID=2054166 RepID=UPI000C77B98C|nr:hypothetical protein [Bacillus sp. M6-12]PLS17695.1 hypothetical protein CVD28_10720 [Bacillus sp. M6-12]